MGKEIMRVSKELGIKEDAVAIANNLNNDALKFKLEVKKEKQELIKKIIGLSKELGETEDAVALANIDNQQLKIMKELIELRIPNKGSKSTRSSRSQNRRRSSARS